MPVRGRERPTGWNGNNCVSDLVAKVGFSGLLHLSKNHSADFLRSLEGKKKEGGEAYYPCHSGRLTKSRSPPLCLTVMAGLPFFSVTLKGQCFMSRVIS